MSKMVITNEEVAFEVIERFLEKECRIDAMRMMNAVRDGNKISWYFLACQPHVFVAPVIHINGKEFVQIKLSQPIKIRNGETLALKVDMFWSYGSGNSPSGKPIRTLGLELSCAA